MLNMPTIPNINTEARLITPWLMLSIGYGLGISISYTLQYIIFLSILALMGIPHGALDHLVAKKNREIKGSSFSIHTFLILYLSRMLIFALIWYISPTFALCIFLIISALHFGETDLYDHTFYAFFYGAGILLFLLLSHFDEVLPILRSIPVFSQSNWLQKLNAYSTNLSILSAGITLMVILIRKVTLKQKLFLILRTILILGIVYALPLLLSFSFYFGCWHSIRSMESIKKHLSQNNVLMTWAQLWKEAFLFSMIAIFFILILSYFLYTHLGMSTTLMSLFIGVAILTAPHLSIMSEMFQHLHKSNR